MPSLLATAALDAAISAEISALPSTPAKREQPAHLLKFRNHAIGANTGGPGSQPHAGQATRRGANATAVLNNAEEKADVDMDVSGGGDNHVLSESTPLAAKKKRRSDVNGDTPKKKKLKA